MIIHFMLVKMFPIALAGATARADSHTGKSSQKVYSLFDTVS